MPHNTPISIARADEVVTEMHILREALDEHGDDLSKYRKAVKILTVAVIVAAMAATAGMVVAGLARESVIDMRFQRNEARVVACTSFNDQLDIIEAAIVNASAGAIRSLVSEPTLTPEQQERFDRYVMALENETAETLDPARRDCTPAGIAAYYHTR